MGFISSDGKFETHYRRKKQMTELTLKVDDNGNIVNDIKIMHHVDNQVFLQIDGVKVQGFEIHTGYIDADPHRDFIERFEPQSFMKLVFGLDSYESAITQERLKQEYDQAKELEFKFKALADSHKGRLDE